jgi:hypothetical protein
MLTRVGVPVESKAERSAPDSERPTLLCFSHLRWNFVFQRPQHLMSRFAEDMTVDLLGRADGDRPPGDRFLKVREAEDFPNVRVVVPHLPEGHERGAPRGDAEAPARRACRDDQGAAGRLVLHADDAALLAAHRRRRTVYDCMDELSQVQVRARNLLELEQELIDKLRPRLHRRLEPLRGQEGPPRQRPLLPLVGRPRALRARRAALFDPADQADLPARASASTASSTSASTSSCSTRSPRCAPTGRS